MTTRSKLAVVLTTILAGVLIPHMLQAAPSRGTLEQRLESLDEEISRLTEQYNQARLDLENSEKQIRSLDLQKQKADQDLAALKQQADRRAVAAYKFGFPRMFMMLVTSGSVSDFEERVSALGTVNQWENGLFQQLEVTRDRSSILRESLGEELATKRKTLEAISVQRTQLETKSRELERMLRNLDAAAASRTRIAPRRPVVQQPAVDYSSLPVSEKAKIAVQTAYQQLGKPYRYGTAGPNSFDCAGLTKYSWGKAGVYLPHGTHAQYGAVKRVSRSAMVPGDLVFYFGQYDHVGLYIGDSKMIHSPRPGERVRIDDIDYMPGFRGGGRPGV